MSEMITVLTWLGPMDTPIRGGKPPLVVNVDPINGYYNITHTPSGYSINGVRSYTNVKEARKVRNAVLGLLDWTQEGKAITRQVKRDPVLRQKLVDAGLNLTAAGLKVKS